MTQPDREEPSDEEEGAELPAPEPAGDWLAEVGARAGLGEETIDALAGWLAEQAEEDRFAQLERAGHSVEERIPLERVFVDLAVSPSPTSEVGPRQGEGQRFLAFLNLPAAARRAAWRVAQADVSERRGGIEGYALIGGPGQGKSTLGQLLCQLHRVWLLHPRFDRIATREQRSAVQAFTDERAVRDLGRPAELRFPLRIALADAASWLAKRGDTVEAAGVPTLLAYLRERGGCPVAPAELLRLLDVGDWILVLDGLDEVPASADRGRLLDVARELVARLGHAAERRGLVIATTRPQGYSGELGDLGVAMLPRYLVPFSKPQALAYARRLVEARFLPSRRAKVIERLDLAAEGETTARLMATPLQITILATLVDRIGRAPSEPWTLFREYYRVIYEREMERPFDAAELLKVYRRYIDKIHAHVGLLLQVEAEQSGGTEAALTRARFRQVVDATLAEDEIDGARREELVSRIEGALRERLVLLVEKKQDELGFEIRSIQEFMAAWALSQKSDAIVEQRILQIAGASSFRNVVLFLSSRGFTDSDAAELRDAITERICPHLNDDAEDPLAGPALPGSVLALEILEEGSALKQAKYVKRLVQLAVRLLELPPGQVQHRLAMACLKDEDARQVAKPILETAIAGRLANEVPAQRLGAWVALLALVDAGDEWARERANTHWQDDAFLPTDLVRVLHEDDLRVGGWLEAKIAAAPGDFDPVDAPRLMFDSRLGATGAVGINVDPWHAATWLQQRVSSVSLNVRAGGHDSPVDVKFTPLRPHHGRAPRVAQGLSKLAAMSTARATWRPWLSAARFACEPTAHTLAEELRELADVFDAEHFDDLASCVPWPLGACMGVASSAQGLRDLADRALSGALGDFESWRAAEEGWLTRKHIELDEIIEAAGSTWPAECDRVDGAIPLAAASFWSPINPVKYDPVWLSLLRPHFQAARSRVIRSVLADWIARVLHRLARVGETAQMELLPDELRALALATKGLFPLEVLCPIEPWRQPSNRARWAEVLDELGRRRGTIGIAEVDHLRELPAFVAGLYEEAPDRSGLLYVLRFLAMMGGKPAVPRALLSPERHAEPYVRESAEMVLVASGQASPEEAEEIAARFARVSKKEHHPATGLLRVLQNTPQEPALVERSLRALAQNAPPGDWDFATHVSRAMSAALSRRQSNLDDPAVWDRLHLPFPRPERRRTSSRPPASEQPRLQVDAFTIQNVRAFDEFSLQPEPPPADAGQWTVILGENGMGKTTLLRSIAFALVDISKPGVLPKAAFAAPWRRAGAAPDDPAGVSVTVNGTKLKTEIRRVNDEDSIKPEPGVPRVASVFAYGCRRGSALGGAPREISYEPGAEIATLFDEGAGLIHAETWLALRAYDARENPDGAAAQVWSAVRAALLAILPDVRDVRVHERRIVVQSQDGGEVPLAALSDGYLTTIGWTIDLVARWVERAERRKEPIPENFTKVMTGLVLLDEIDLHLHPEWQRHVIADVRAIFPRMSFIVTTHNPLTLLGARAEEIWKLERNGGGRIVAVKGRELPALMTSSEIYESYFGIKSLFPSELGEMLNRYGFLARDPVRSDEEDEEMRRLLTALRERGVEPGIQPVDRESIPPYSAGDRA